MFETDKHVVLFIADRSKWNAMLTIYGSCEHMPRTALAYLKHSM